MYKKKGQGLSMNVVILAVLGVIVLVILAVIFTGGIGVLYQKIAGIFGGTTGGESLVLAENNCKLLCEQAKGLTADNQKKSAYCTKKFKVDTNGDGKAEVNQDGEPKKFACSSNTRVSYDDLIGISCSEVKCVGSTDIAPATPRTART